MLNSSVYGIVAVALDRFLVVLHPLWYRAKLSRRNVVIVMIFVWVSGPAYYFPLGLGTSGIDTNGQCNSYDVFGNEGWLYSSAIFGFIYQYLFPLVCLVYFYIKMILALRDKHNPMIKGTIINKTIITISSVQEVQENIDAREDGKNSENDIKVCRNKEINDRIDRTCEKKPQRLAEKDEKALSQKQSRRITAIGLTAIGSQKCVGHDLKPHDISDKSSAKDECSCLRQHERKNVGKACNKLSENRNIAFVHVNSTGLSNKDRPSEVTKPPASACTTNVVAKTPAILTASIVIKLSTTRARHNLVKTLITIGLVSLLCWSWNQILVLVFYFGVTIDFAGVFFNFTVVMGYVSCCINPIIYCVQYQKFQQGLRALVFGNTKVAFCKNMVTPTND